MAPSFQLWCQSDPRVWTVFFGSFCAHTQIYSKSDEGVETMEMWDKDLEIRIVYWQDFAREGVKQRNMNTTKRVWV